MSIPLTPLWYATRACIDCELRNQCRGPVPAVGNIGSQIMFVGEGPGEQEDRDGLPFQGRAGKYLDYLLDSIGLPREQVIISNVVKCHLPDNRDPLPHEIEACHKWLDIEIQTYKPKLIVVLGLFASRYLLNDSTFTMEKGHGIPRLVDNRIILPIFHPASGLHQTRNMRFIQEDFGVLEQIVKGADVQNLIPQDQYPNPDYREVTNVKEAIDLLSQPKFALDTETVWEDNTNQVWSVQVSSSPGTGYFIPVSLFGRGDSLVSLDGVVRIPEESQVIVHNWLYDAQFLALPNPLDSMVAAWLLQLPMGLKELAFRYCGMEMHSYEEYVLPYRNKKAMRYLYGLTRYMAEIWTPQNPKAKKPKKFKRAIIGFPDPPSITDWEWDNKQGELREVEKHPHNITTKILDRIRKGIADSEYDVYSKWWDIDERERVLVEKAAGKMPGVDLRDAPYEQAVYYSTRDPDATWRWWEVAEGMLREQGLWEVFEMEMGRCSQ